MRLALGIVLLLSGLPQLAAAQDARAQALWPPPPRFFGLIVDRVLGVVGIELIEDASGAQLRRTTMFGCSSELAAEVAITTRADGGRDARWEDQYGPHAAELVPAEPGGCELTSALVAQCVYAGEADEHLAPCSSVTAARRLVASATRRLAPLLAPGAALVLTDQAIHTTPPSVEIDAADLALLDAFAHPRSTVHDALARFVARGDVQVREGTDPGGALELPAALAPVVAVTTTTWMAEAEQDHVCDAACGGCIPIGDRAFERERTELPRALSRYVAALDDALWARHAVLAALPETRAAEALAGVDRGSMETACGAANWRHPSYRACVDRTLRGHATEVAASLLAPRP